MPLPDWCLLHQTVYSNKMAFIDFNPPVQVMNILFVQWFYSISKMCFFVFFFWQICSTSYLFDSLEYNHNFLYYGNSMLYFSRRKDRKKMCEGNANEGQWSLCAVPCYCVLNMDWKKKKETKYELNLKILISSFVIKL